VQQEVILEVIGFRFDPSKGAAECTPLTALIDHRLKAIRRKAKRYAARITSAGDTMTLTEGRLLYEDSTAIRLDVMAAMSRLTRDEIAICLRLIEGQSVRQIARRLHRGWHSINRIVAGIRKHFRLMGLDTQK
jgi:DNA-binding NarL/FixJ family response regulator